MNPNRRLHEAIVLVTDGHVTYPAHYDAKKGKLLVLQSPLDEDMIPVDDLVAVPMDNGRVLWLWKDKALAVFMGHAPMEEPNPKRVQFPFKKYAGKKTHGRGRFVKPRIFRAEDWPDPITELERAEASILASLGIDPHTVSLPSWRGDANDCPFDPFNHEHDEEAWFDNPDLDDPDSIPGGPNSRLI